MFKKLLSWLKNNQQFMISTSLPFLRFGDGLPRDLWHFLHDLALSANDENVLKYRSKEYPDEKKYQLIIKSNVTIVVMSNTVVNRGLTSEMQHVIDGIYARLSVSDGQCGDDVGVFLVRVATAAVGGSVLEIKNQNTRSNHISNTLTTFSAINGIRKQILIWLIKCSSEFVKTCFAFTQN